MWKKASLALLITVALAACGGNPDVTNKKDEPKTSDAWKDDEPKNEKAADLPVQPADEQGMPEEAEKTGHYYKEGIGEIQVEGIGYNEELGLNGTHTDLKPLKSGPMELLIGKLHVVDMKIEEGAFVPAAGDKDHIKVIIADMAARNTSDVDVSYYPDQAVAVTNTGEQIDPEIIGDQVGGDFLGKVKKEGQVWWVLQNTDEKIESVKLVFSAPSNTDYDDIGDEKRIEFDVKPYKEASKEGESPSASSGNEVTKDIKADEPEHIDGVGTLTPISYGYNDRVGIDGKDTKNKPLKLNGIEFTIDHFGIYNLETEGDFKPLFNNRKTVDTILVSMKIENKSKKKIIFNPDASEMKTDQKETALQVETAPNTLGGNLPPGEKREAFWFWEVKKNPDKVKEVTMEIPSTYLETQQAPNSKPIKLTFEMLNPKDAEKRDKKK